MRGKVELKGVSASYDGDSLVVAGVDITMEAGEKIALCGRTGRYVRDYPPHHLA